MPYRPNFVANLSTMFADKSIVNRFMKAKELGFESVEIQDVYKYDLKELVEAKQASGMNVALINSPSTEKVPSSDAPTFGLACVAGSDLYFADSVLRAVEYAFPLRCQKIHILAGLKQKNLSEENMMKIFSENMEWAVSCLEEHDIMGLIEPICPAVKPNYFLDSFQKTADIIMKIGSKHLRMLLDVYHLHKLEDNVESGLRQFVEYAGHVQISQAPGRKEPFADGEIDYGKVLDLLSELNYNGQIGLEYTPSDPENGFKWLEKYKVA